jgi:hypothetical protein
MGRIAALPAVKYWIYASPVWQKIKMERACDQCPEKYEYLYYAHPGFTLRLKVGDVVYRLVSGRWVKLFRIRKARGLPAIHYGKKFGDRWYWIHCHPDKHHLTEVI